MRVKTKPSHELNSEEETFLYTSPWVDGARAVAYFGPISYEIFLPDDKVVNRSLAWFSAVENLLQNLHDKAKGIGANAVVRVEITLDPFGNDSVYHEKTGLKLHVVGTAAKLEPLC
jgi:hypothetical protein